MRVSTLILILELGFIIVGCSMHSSTPQPQPTPTPTPFSPTFIPQSFQRTQLTSTFYAEGVAIGDFNRDGITDIVAGPYWYAGPTFQQKFAYYTPAAFDPATSTSNNFLTFVYDFNHDGWPDILVINFPGSDASWFENPKGANTMWVKHQVINSVNDESPAFVDIDGDGVPELVYIDSNGNLGWATPNSADPTIPWTFHPISSNTNYGTFTHGLGVGDINGDGRLDILEANGWWEQPASLAGDPLWTFHPVNFGIGSQMYAVDLDGDGLNDVVVSSPHNYGLWWFQQVRVSGQITFCKHMIMGDPSTPTRFGGVSFSELHSLVVADIDGDGVPDIVTGKRHWAHGPTGDVDPNGPSVLYWFRTVRTPQGVDFIPYQIDNNSGVGTQFVVADVNGDGKLDVVISNKNGTFFMQQTTGQTATPQPQSSPIAACQP